MDSRVVQRPDVVQHAEQGLIVEGYASSQTIEDLRNYPSELEVQNKALRYSQNEAEGASKRYANG